MTVSDLQVFAFQGAEVRTFAETDGVPWFAAADVCALLGHSNSRKAVRDLLDDDQWRTVSAGRADCNQAFRPGRGGANTLTVVDESGVYGLILGSRVPGAKPFRRWLTREVIPAIRQRGVYATPEVNRELAAAVAGAHLAIDAVLASSTVRAERVYRDGGTTVSPEDRAADLAETRALVDARQHLATLGRRFPAEGSVAVPAAVARLAQLTGTRAGPVTAVDPWEPTA